MASRKSPLNRQFSMSLTEIFRTTAGGSSVQIPTTKLDILYCGCSCVDYSSMNTQKSKRAASEMKLKIFFDKHSRGKTASRIALDHEFVSLIDEDLKQMDEEVSIGESARTFSAAIKLMLKLRPKAIIMENVFGAPWDLYQDTILPSIGYAARFLRLDSKDYCLPQTRARGYLVAADAQFFGQDIALKVALTWVERMKSCQRYVSAPVTAFLRPADDPRIIQSRAELDNKREPNPSSYRLSNLRHIETRDRLQIQKDAHPFSNMVMHQGNVVFATFPSHSWIDYWKRQPTRVIDVMDICVAHGLNQQVDIRFKPLLVDVSQNIDRTPLTHSPSALNRVGIIGCLTPSGQPIITNRMRPVTGVEVLALQGLPVDEMILATETQAQMQDLAGNAMSVTVIGAASLSLISAIASLSPSSFNASHSAGAPRNKPFGIEYEPVSPPNRRNMLAIGNPLSGLCRIARGATRLCFCLHSVIPNKDGHGWLRCDDCGATACSLCRGNPIHNFVFDANLRPRYSSAEARVELSKFLPTVFVLPPMPDIANILKAVNQPLYCDVLDEILASSTEYYLDDIKITEVVTVCYKAKKSIARLVLSEKSATLYILVAPDHDKRPSLFQFFDIDQPIARLKLRVAEHDNIDWRVWVDGQVDFTLPVKVQDDGSMIVGTLQDGAQGLPEELQELKAEVQRQIAGTFYPKPKCGTPRDALMAKEGADGKKIFVVLHATELGNPRADCFVFSPDPRKHEGHEYRETLLTVEAQGFVADTGKKEADLAVFWRGYWARCSPGEEVVPGYSQENQELASIIKWGAIAPKMAATKAIKSTVLAVVTVGLCNFPASAAGLMRSIEAGRIHNGDYATVPNSQREVFLKLFAFAATEVQAANVPTTGGQLGHLRGEWITVDVPDYWCPVPPTINFDGNELFEDKREAERYESRIKLISQPVSLGARLDTLRTGDSSLEMVIRLEPLCLPARALAHLRNAHPTSIKGRQALKENVTTSFTVQLDYKPPVDVRFEPLSAMLRPCSASNMEGIDPSRDLDYALPDLTGDPEPFRKCGQKLRPEQLQSVEWMVYRECMPVDFLESEIEEEIVSGANLRVVGKAEWENGHLGTRGGVVAHEVGYGKTVVMLALIAHQEAFDQGWALTEREKFDVS